MNVECLLEMETGRAGPRTGPGQADLLGPGVERAKNGPKIGPEVIKIKLFDKFLYKFLFFPIENFEISSGEGEGLPPPETQLN